MIDAEISREITGGVFQRSASVLIGRKDAAVDTERSRYQGVTEEKALDLRQWQHTTDLSANLGQQIVRTVSEGSREDVLPFREVKKGTLQVGVDERIPGGPV
jgi:hypothetical protein